MAQKKKVQYYTIQFEKFLEIVSETEKTNTVLSYQIKDTAEKTPLELWDNSSMLDLLDSFLLVNAFRDFLDDKVNNPDKEEVDFMTKNEIKDVLFTKEQLEVLQSFFLAIEGKKQFLINHYNFSCYLN